ncbi:MAG: pyruvate kinase [Anaerolineaceae bacterium]|jgi:pyruvate kinase|nr:pyruvate kinase [Anaerolineaceae bacterium]
MNYDIIATLGPGSSEPALWEDMLAAGATAFRLNTSHLTLPQTLAWLEKLEKLFQATGRTIPVVLDLQGSKWRLGKLPAADLKSGQQIELRQAASSDQSAIFPVPHKDFFLAAAASNGEIILNDAKLRLQIESVNEENITARVTQAGPIAANKGITLAASDYRHEGLSQKDAAIFEQTRSFGFVRYAISYIKDAAEMTAYRSQLGSTAYLIAKLERRQAMQEAVEIAASADELWVCRGDLGAEVGLKALAEIVLDFAAFLPRIKVPVIMAGQVLEHMTRQPAPTRSEVCYLYETLQRGYQGFVLSDEAAIGLYPIESCAAAALFRN